MNSFTKWRLRRAQEKYAYWKAKREMLEKQLQTISMFSVNSYNIDRTIRAAGKEAQMMERVEILMRQ